MFRSRVLSGCVAKLCLIALPLNASDTGKIVSTQNVVTEWARVRQEKIRMESQWESEKSLIASLVTAMESRLEALNSEKRVLVSKARAHEESQAELAGKNEEVKSRLKEAEDQLVKCGEKLLQLRPNLPPRLSRGLEMAFRSLGSSQESISERSQTLAEILNRCAQFDQSITSGEESLGGAQGAEERLIEVVYWGSSCAYGLDRASGKTYVGRPGKVQWEWMEKAGIGDAVAALLAQMRDKADPAFVELPVELNALSSSPGT
jgi:hypothetical protein